MTLTFDTHLTSLTHLFEYYKLDICVQRTRMPPSGASIKVLALSDNYRSIKADLYNIEETNEGQCRSKRLAFRLQSNLGYEYEINMFSSLPIHSISLNYDLDLYTNK